jgi:hypothetical protein
MNKLLGALAIAVLTVTGSSSARAAVESIGRNSLSGGWEWSLIEDGYFGGQRYNVDRIVVQEISGAKFEPATFRQLSKGWSDVYDSGGVAIASGADLTKGYLSFQMWFLGNYDPHTSVHYYAYSDGKVVGSGVAYDKGCGYFCYLPDRCPQVPPTSSAPEPTSVLIWCLLGAGSWLGMRLWRR